MNEINARKNLYGFGGWLVLFQIYIFMTLAQAVQSVIALMLMGSLIRGGFYDDFFWFSDFNPMDFFKVFTSPYVYGFMVVSFVLTLLVVIFFYRKKIVFRTLFIIQSVVSIIGFVLYYINIMGQMDAMFFDGFMEIGKAMMIFTGVISFIPALGIPLALTIALFKSQRVKDTFGLGEKI